MMVPATMVGGLAAGWVLEMPLTGSTSNSCRSSEVHRAVEALPASKQAPGLTAMEMRSHGSVAPLVDQLPGDAAMTETAKAALEGRHPGRETVTIGRVTTKAVTTTVGRTAMVPGRRQESRHGIRRRPVRRRMASPHSRVTLDMALPREWEHPQDSARRLVLLVSVLLLESPVALTLSSRSTAVRLFLRHLRPATHHRPRRAISHRHPLRVLSSEP